MSSDRGRVGERNVIYAGFRCGSVVHAIREPYRVSSYAKLDSLDSASSTRIRSSPVEMPKRLQLIYARRIATTKHTHSYSISIRISLFLFHSMDSLRRGVRRLVTILPSVRAIPSRSLPPAFPSSSFVPLVASFQPEGGNF